MKRPQTLLIAGLCAGGLLAGYLSRRWLATPATAATPQAAAVRVAAPAGGGGAGEAAPVGRRGPRGARSAPAAEIPHEKSADTLETLLALRDDELYSRLALWLIDASEPEMAEFWAAYGPRDGRSNDITDLLFLNWARLDPHAAISKSGSDHHAWWAWACHDPDAALAEARANSPGYINPVAWGIGEFHPEWLRQHYAELSEDAQSHARRGMAKWSDAQDPLATMKFLKEIGGRIDKGTFRALVRQDPWAALDWVKENPGRGGDGGLDYSINDPMDFIVDVMARERPEDLARLAGQTPSGMARMKMESTLFAALLQTDRAAALEQADATDAPRVAAERFAALGLEAVKTDREEAFRLMEKMFAKCPNAVGMMAMVEYPGGASGGGVQIPGVNELVSGLMTQDPGRTLDLMVGLTPDRFGERGFHEFANQWAARDLAAYAEWVGQQSDEETRSSATSVGMGILRAQGRNGEAADWALGLPDAVFYNQFSNLMRQWEDEDPDAAAAWLESADLSPTRRKKVDELLQSHRRVR